MALQSIPDPTFDFCSSFLPPAPMCDADDVFHMGMILPLGAAPPPKVTERRGNRRWPKEAHAESFSLPRPAWGGGPAKPEYQRLRSASERSDAKPPPHPRRRLCLLGSVRVPATMDMREIRNRQRGRCPAADVNASGGATWKLLRSLSCKGVESTAIVAATPLGLVSHVRAA